MLWHTSTSLCNTSDTHKTELLAIAGSFYHADDHPEIFHA